MRTLLLAYYFPPIGGGGVQRSLKFARYLPEFGYDVTVVTGPGTTVDRWSPEDRTLTAQTLGADVRRVSETEPVPSPWQIRREKWVGISSPWSRWWKDGVQRASRDLAGEVDVVISSLPPYEAADAAAALAESLGCPWVADLRDLWALDELMLYVTGAHRRLDLQRMRRVLSTAAAVVTVSNGSTERLRARLPELADRPVVSIPNGFDRQDFEGVAPERSDGTFRIVHAGSLYTDIGLRNRSKLRRLLRGSSEGVDIVPQSLVYVLKAIERLIERDPDLRSSLEVLRVGVVADTDRQLAEGSPVRMVGYLPHSEAIAAMRTADLLFLPLFNLAPGMRSATVPGKTYEYLAAQRPILAALPAGDARDILAEAGNAYLCAPDDVDAMAAAIAAQLGNGGALHGNVPEAFLERFERRRLTAELASVLDAVTGRPGRDVSPAPDTPPGSVESAL